MAQHVSLWGQPYSDSHNSPRPQGSFCGSLSIPTPLHPPTRGTEEHLQFLYSALEEEGSPAFCSGHSPSLPCSDQSQSLNPTVHLSLSPSPLSVLLSFPLIGQIHFDLPNTSLRPVHILLLLKNSFSSELHNLPHDCPLVTSLPPPPRPIPFGNSSGWGFVLHIIKR